MITDYHAIAYKSGVGALNRWDITFDETDFSGAVGAAWIEGPFSLVIDADCTICTYPVLIGLELVGIAGSIFIGDRTHIAFASRERRVISSASVPQLAYITGTVKKIIVHCYGWSSSDGARSKVGLRIGPPAVISAPQPMIGRDTLVFDAGVYFTVDSGLVAIGAGLTSTLWSVNVSPLTGIRFWIKAVSVTFNPTPSYGGDLECIIEMVDSSAIVQEMHKVCSRSDDFAHYLFNDGLMLDRNYTLRARCTNNNAAAIYSVRSFVTYGEIY